MEQLATTLLLVAGGKGVRMGSAVPKQFLPLSGKPVLYYSIKPFLDAFPDIKIILVLPEEHISYGNILLQAMDEGISLTIVKGGITRFHSVQNGLKEVESNSIVFIHDGVRPLVNRDLVERCYHTAADKGVAIPVLPVTDSIRQWNGTSFAVIDRAQLRSVQTPQTFRSELIVKAYDQEYKEMFTDDATVAEISGLNIHFVAGQKENIKITTPEDLWFAETRIGQQSTD